MSVEVPEINDAPSEEATLYEPTLISCVVSNVNVANDSPFSFAAVNLRTYVLPREMFETGTTNDSKTTSTPDKKLLISSTGETTDQNCFVTSI